MAVTHAFIDESARPGGGYYVCVAAVVDADLVAARRLARSHLLARQRRWHFTEESNARRQRILDSIVNSGLVTAMVASGRGREVQVRERCLTALGQPLIDRQTSRVILESREGRDGVDRQTLARVLGTQPGAFTYAHRRPAEDSGLWLADAIAWSYSAGGHWRRRLDPILGFSRETGRA